MSPHLSKIHTVERYLCMYAHIRQSNWYRVRPQMYMYMEHRRWCLVQYSFSFQCIYCFHCMYVHVCIQYTCTADHVPVNVCNIYTLYMYMCSTLFYTSATHDFQCLYMYMYNTAFIHVYVYNIYMYTYGICTHTLSDTVIHSIYMYMYMQLVHW